MNVSNNLCEQTMILVKQFSEPIYVHLTETLKISMAKIFASLTPHFLSHFCTVFDIETLEGLYDIIIGGAPLLLSYIALSIIIRSKSRIISMKSEEEFQEFWINLRGIDFGSVAGLAVDMWERPVLDNMPNETRKLLSG